jgi:ketosteroid isomerase-like protein
MTGTTTQETRAVVEAYVAALQRGDIEALRASFAPDATWWLRGDLPTSGTWTGPDASLDGFLRQMTERLDTTRPLTQELTRIVADGEYAVAEWTSRATTRSGRPYENDYAVVFRVRDGRIASVREHFDTAYAARVLFDQKPIVPQPAPRRLPGGSTPTDNPFESLHVDDVPTEEVTTGITRRRLTTSGHASGWLIDFAPHSIWPATDHHEDEERYYVLSGEVLEGPDRFPAGTYVTFHAGSSHRPSSEVGASILGINLVTGSGVVDG